MENRCAFSIIFCGRCGSLAVSNDLSSDNQSRLVCRGCGWRGRFLVGRVAREKSEVQKMLEEAIRDNQLIGPVRGAWGLPQNTTQDYSPETEIEAPRVAQETGRKCLTFDLICELEPRVELLWREAQAIKIKDDGNTSSFCANITMNDFKSRIRKLVGYQVDDAPEILKDNIAYDLVYQMIYQTLPYCRNCGCGVYIPPET